VLLCGAVAWLASLDYYLIAGQSASATVHFIFVDLLVFPGFVLLAAASLPLLLFRTSGEFAWGLVAVFCALPFHYVVATFLGHGFEWAPVATETCVLALGAVFYLCRAARVPRRH